MDVITVNELAHSYGSKKVFENVNFSLEKGSITGLLGKNGAGKTTIINILNGFLRPTSGTAYIYNEEAHILSNATKEKIGFLIEGHIQYNFMSIAQIEHFYSGFYTKWDKNRYYELIDLMHLKPNHKLKDMSCGQRSQVALGLIFAQNPGLIILDDFSMGLDPGYRRLFIEYLQYHVRKENITVFVTSHIIQDMEKLIDEVMILHNHELAVKSPLDSFMNNVNMYTFPESELEKSRSLELPGSYNIEYFAGTVHLFTAKELAQVRFQLKNFGVTPESVIKEQMSLEDAFIGYTGSY